VSNRKGAGGRHRGWCACLALAAPLLLFLTGVGALEPVPAGAATPIIASSTPLSQSQASRTPPASYWEVASDGGIFSFGSDAQFFGSTGGMTLNKPVVGMAAAPDGGGYWLVASDGGIFSYGDAQFYGSTGSIHLNEPIVGMAATPDGGGYWLVASDGGIFSYGDAQFYGSTGSIHLNKPIVGMAATPDGGGYWLVASDGGIFSYGDAQFYGSTGSIHLNKPIVGMAASPSGHGYWLVASDGGIFNYGDAGFYGSTGSIRLNEPIVGMMATLSGNGYWLVASDGGIFNYGSAGFSGSMGGTPLNKPIVGLATPHFTVPLGTLCRGSGVVYNAENGCPYDGTATIGSDQLPYEVLIGNNVRSVYPTFWDLINFPATTCTSVQVSFGIPQNGGQPGDVAYIQLREGSTTQTGSSTYGNISGFTMPLNGAAWSVNNSSTSSTGYIALNLTATCSTSTGY